MMIWRNKTVNSMCVQYCTWKISKECMQTVIVPICKNKNGDIRQVMLETNLFPLPLSSVIIKLFKCCILSCISYQFGCKWPQVFQAK